MSKIKSNMNKPTCNNGNEQVGAGFVSSTGGSASPASHCEDEELLFDDRTADQNFFKPSSLSGFCNKT